MFWEVKTENTFTERFVLIAPINYYNNWCVWCAGGQVLRFDPSAYVENKRRQQKENEEKLQLVPAVYPSIQEIGRVLFLKQDTSLFRTVFRLLHV